MSLFWSSAARRVAARPRSRYHGGTSKAVRWMAKQAVEVQVVEKGGTGRLVQQTLRENGCSSFKNIREACHMEPVTTDIPVPRDRTSYSVFLLLRAEACDMEEIRAYSAVNCVNYMEAKRHLIQQKNFLTCGDAYYIKSVLDKLRHFLVAYEIEPPYPYE